MIDHEFVIVITQDKQRVVAAAQTLRHSNVIRCILTKEREKRFHANLDYEYPIIHEVSLNCVNSTYLIKIIQFLDKYRMNPFSESLFDDDCNTCLPDWSRCVYSDHFEENVDFTIVCHLLDIPVLAKMMMHKIRKKMQSRAVQLKASNPILKPYKLKEEWIHMDNMSEVLGKIRRHIFADVL